MTPKPKKIKGGVFSYEDIYDAEKIDLWLASIDWEEEIGKFINHYYCEDDNWYSCPLAPGGCSDIGVPEDKCNCGRGKQIESIAKAIRKTLEVE